MEDWRNSTIRIDASSLRRSLHNLGEDLRMKRVMLFSINSYTQMVAMSGANLLRMVKGRWGKDCQFSKRMVMDDGGGTGADVLPTQTPWVVYSMQRLRARTSVGI